MGKKKRGKHSTLSIKKNKNCFVVEWVRDFLFLGNYFAVKIENLPIEKYFTILRNKSQRESRNDVILILTCHVYKLSACDKIIYVSGGRGKGSKGSKGQTVASRPEVAEERREQEPLVPPIPPFRTGAPGAKPEAFGRGGGSFKSPRPKDKNQKGFGPSGTTEEKKVETLGGAVHPEKTVRVATKSYFPHNHPSYDAQKLLYNAKRLPVANDVVTGKVTIQTDIGEKQEFTKRIQLNGTVDLSPLHNLLQKKNIGEDEAYQCVAAVLRKAFSDSSANMEKRLDLTLNQNEEFLGTETRQHSGKMSEDLVPALDEDLKNCDLQNERAIHRHSSTPTMKGKKKTKSTMHKEDTALKSFFPQYFLSSNLWSSELPLGTNIQEWRVIGVEVRREVVNSQIDVFIKMVRSHE
jgi:hypothetical protein